MVTPCERLGYKVGDRFKLLKDLPSLFFRKDDIVELYKDEGSMTPMFRRLDDYKLAFLHLDSLESIDTETSKNCPEHYDNIIQPWEYMQSCMSPEEFRGYLRGNVIKYISRYMKKDRIKDLDKAKHYLEELIEFEKGMLDG